MSKDTDIDVELKVKVLNINYGHNAALIEKCKSLKKYRQEVLGMLLEEFDVEKYERTLKEEGRDEGIEFGIRALVNTCFYLGASTEQTINSLMKEFSLSQEAAETYYKKYSEMLSAPNS